jgi:hypothetical protein
MAYSDIWTNANDADFQGRCWAALWDVANKVLADTTGYPASGQEATNAEDDDVYSKNILTDKVSISGRQLAQQVLRNTTIANNPATATDADILFQINSIWAELRELG